MRLLPVLLVLLVSPARAFQAAPELAREPPRVRGHVVSEADGAPIQGARVEPQGFRINGGPVVTDETGAFDLPDAPRCRQSTATDNVGIDYLRVSEPAHGVALVDPCSNAPWADPVRLRPGATLTGGFRRDRKGKRLTVRLRASELAWQPRPSLVPDERTWSSTTNANGLYVLDNLPGQGPLFVLLDGKDIGTLVVLRPEERCEADLSNGSEPWDRPEAAPDSGSCYTPIRPSAEGGLQPPDRTYYLFPHPQTH